ncbi:hypothetical protein RFM41_33050 [Mesorhizobium sp. VK25A]|uniref:Uncharacterized protein n=1 Tax=Mesorhizobium vachelliae TaxID=3072309 RepID=A0ABU5AEY8_9HYPH|nr:MULTISPECIES: hypothetical protein [unclassified Mesorhizobium]MDX8535832.1 hypothetical protein [Mesorhizobium sp. VK25D]MDX8548579.1 hypothetical protein [Mesorhizobium sp. VK25A]
MDVGRRACSLFYVLLLATPAIGLLAFYLRDLGVTSIRSPSWLP